MLALIRSVAAAALCVLVSGALVAGQSQSFDAVSIKPHNDPGPLQLRSGNTGYYATSVTVKAVIAQAFGFRRDRILGAPGWTDTDHFDINARAAVDDASDAQIAVMLKAMLRDRFALGAHVESHQQPVFELVFAKPGHKGPDLKTAKPCTPGTVSVDDAPSSDDPSRTQRREYHSRRR